MPILRRHSLWTALNHTIYEHAIYLLKRIRWNFFTKRLLNFLLPIPNCMDKSVQDKLDSVTYQGQGM